MEDFNLVFRDVAERDGWRICQYTNRPCSREVCKNKYFTIVGLQYVSAEGELITGTASDDWLFATQEEAEAALSLYLLRRST